MKAEDAYIKQILVGLTHRQIADLEEMADDVRLPRSQIIRDAVDLVLRAYFKRKKGIPDGDPTDSSGSN